MRLRYIVMLIIYDFAIQTANIPLSSNNLADDDWVMPDAPPAVQEPSPEPVEPPEAPEPVPERSTRRTHPPIDCYSPSPQT